METRGGGSKERGDLEENNVSKARHQATNNRVTIQRTSGSGPIGELDLMTDVLGRKWD